LTKKMADDATDIFKWLQVAMKNRVVRGHDLNAVSSRSHMVVIVKIIQQQRDGKKLSSRINFADLAGSEKSKKTGHKSGSQAMRELIGINKSLSTLTMCIQQILKNQKPNFRDSKLTHLLSESLNGNCKTTLIVACSPSAFNRDETVNTLRFAKNAKEVKTKAKVNQELSKKQLHEEIERLQKVQKGLEADKFSLISELEGWKKKGKQSIASEELMREQSNRNSALLAEIEYLKQRLKETQAELEDLKRQLENRDEEVVTLRNELEIKESEARQMQSLLEAQYQKEQELSNQLQMLTKKKVELDQTKLLLEKAKRAAEAEVVRLMSQADCDRLQLQSNKEEIQKYLQMIDGLTAQIAQADEMKKSEIVQFTQEISQKDEEIVELRRKLDQSASDTHKLKRKLELAKGNLAAEKKKRTPGREHLHTPRKVEIKRFTFEAAEEVVVLDEPDLEQPQVAKTALEDKDGNIHLRVTDTDLVSMTNDIENCLARWKEMNNIPPSRGKNNFSDIVLKTRLLVGYFNSAMGKIKELLNKQAPQVAGRSAKEFRKQEQMWMNKMRDTVKEHNESYEKMVVAKDDQIKKLTEERNEAQTLVDEREKEILALKNEIEKMKRSSTIHDMEADRHALNLMTMLSQQDLLAFEDEDLSDLSEDDSSYDENLIRNSILNALPANSYATSSPRGDDHWRSTLAAGSKLDALDNVQMWYTATVVEMEGDEVKVRFDGFSSKYDESLPIISSRIAPFRTKAIGGKGTPRSSVQLKIAGELGGFTYFKAGNLMKKGGKMFSTGWTNRYCVLYSNYDFAYYSNANASEEKGVFKLEHIVSLEQPGGLEFELLTRDKKWNFRAEDNHEFLEWINILETCRTKIIEDSSHLFTYRRDGSVIMKSKNLVGDLDEDDEKFNERCKTHAVSRHASLANLPIVSSKQRDSLSKPIMPQGKVIACGYLYKVGGFFKTWHRRWIVFSKNRKLKYSEDKGKEVKGEIVLWNIRGLRAVKNADAIQKLHPPLECYQFLFEIETDNRKWVFGAESEESLQTWMRAIQQWAVFTATPAMTKKQEGRFYKGISNGLNDLRRKMSRRRTYDMDMELKADLSRSSVDYARAVKTDRLFEISSRMRREMELEKLAMDSEGGAGEVYCLTFSAEDAISFMVDAGFASTRNEAVALGSLMEADSLIESISNDTRCGFEDRPVTYSFPHRLANVTSRVFKEFNASFDTSPSLSNFDHETCESCENIVMEVPV